MSGFVNAPTGWRRVPIGRLFRRRETRGRSDLPLLSVYRDWGVVQRAGREDNYNKPGEDLDTYKYVRRGDLVLNKMKTWQGSLGVSPYEGIVSPAYFVAESVAAVEPRFIHHLLRSQPLIAEYGARSKGIRPSQWDLPWDEFSRILIALPAERGQRAIADFLDAETARIDALIAKKRRLKVLLEDRYWNWVSDRIRQVDAPTVQLRRALLSITDGPFGSSLTSSHYSDTGARVVRLGNIGMAAFKDDDRAYISTEHYGALLKHRVRAGDLLIAGLGDANNHVGRGCVAPDLGPAIVKADCYCAVVDQRMADVQFLAIYLSSPLGCGVVADLSRGSTRTRINLDVAKSVPVILPPLREQRAIVIEASRRRQTNSLLHMALDRQLDLLAEHRQALITAAVTGRIEVPGAVAS